MRRIHHRAAAVVGTCLAVIALGLLVVGADTVRAQSAGGATLTLSPASGSEAVGGAFTVSVMLASGGGVGVNAADGELSFNPTLLAVQSVSKGNSVFNLWTSNPTFSNIAGTVDYSGGSNDAYTGSSGDIVDVTFKALAAGSATVKFSSATALAADGQGTNVLGGTTGATYVLGGSAAPASAPESTPAASADNAPSAAETPFDVTITVSSPTHPDPSQWYSNDNPSFAWTLTPDIAGVSTDLDQNPGTYPKKSSIGLLSSKQYSNVGEGTWYFHVRFEDALGDWSDPVNFQINIDLTPPLPFTVTAATGAGVSGRANLMFNATDTVSGIDHYMATFDGGSSSTIQLSDVQNGVYTAPPLLPGKHIVQISAFDKAGNYTSENTEFTISGVAMPEITNFPATVIEKSPIVLEGTADSGSNVTVDITNSSGKAVSEGKMVADETGHWLYAVESGLSTGIYALGVSMVTTQGATASSTDKMFINVISAPFLDRFGWIIIVLLLSCIGGLVTYGLYWRKILAMQFSLAKRENEDARTKTRAVFEALREEMDDQISHMEGGAAQAQGEAKLEPERVLDAVRNALVVSETTIQKEIEDVDKALNEE
jgi:hypothetical protein